MPAGGACQTAACMQMQHQINHTYAVEFGVIGWLGNQITGGLAQIVSDIVGAVLSVLLLAGYAGALMALVLTVLYANFGQRIPRPRLLIQAARPENYQ